MRSILEYIGEEITDRETVFVFPSAAPARFWADACAEYLRQPLTPRRFCAWDVFKEKTLSRKQPDKQPINKAMRMLFASSLLKENAQKGFLGEYINPVYRYSYNAFISSLAKLLSGLESVLRRYEETGKENENDAYFADLRLIRERYGAFLEKHKLYEPSWNRGDYADSGNRWILFFPELASDWEEYREELTRLADRQKLRIIPLSGIAPPVCPAPQPERIRRILRAGISENAGVSENAAISENVSENSDVFKKAESVAVSENTERSEHLKSADSVAVQFAFAGDEYRWLALTIRRLLDEARLCPADIGVTAAGNSDTARLIQTLSLYGIPADLREGQAITDYPGGRIFSALSACPGERWSYRSLKNLLLDRAFPWKDTELINALMDFGMKYRCVSGFSGIDVWERTFEWHKDRPAAPGETPVSEISEFYRSLKKNITAMLNASHFKDIKTAWLIFKKNFLKDAFDLEVNKVLGQIIRHLDELIDIEEKYPGLFSGGAHTFSVFQSYLQDQKYVYQARRGSVAVYDYKVAAGIGLAAHFIIGMNQENAAVVYRDGAFLREDRQQTLGMQDRDVSADFMRAYRFSGSFTAFTVSLKTFSGAAVPHRRLVELFGEPVKVSAFPDDPYLIETSIRAGSSPPESAYPAEAQQTGWRHYRVLTKPPLPSDLRSNAVQNISLRSILEDRLTHQSRLRIGGSESLAYLSPTDLNEYLYCPFRWMLERGLLIEEKQTGIETIDQRDMGKLYHNILENFLEKYFKAEGRKFSKESLTIYAEYLAEETREALKKARWKDGAFQNSIYEMLERRICAALTEYLEKDEEVLDGAEVIGAEYILQKTYPAEDMRLVGRADAAMIKAGGLLLTDFKTAAIPGKKEVFAGDREYPDNLQMAAYIGMIENSKPEQVSAARFYSIDNREFRAVVSEHEADEKKTLPRKGYEKEVASVDTVFHLASQALKQGVYAAPKNPDPKKCARCPVSSVCRLPFIGGSRS
ncbi:MAG: PD-(D/E)XK nuclease family protein [Spirochaetaceae bacterium]|jgi:CRISPR/Cas system-associated exonuclease Cas4 (RecB family)|nr:PD-(D/E)XK nuclease family protein [Spirochaetaceae bacterium]